MTRTITDHLVVPVADEADASATAAALDPYPFERITVVNVVEKGDGSLDKLPPEQAEAVARDSFTAFREIVPDVETRVVYARDVVDAIDDLAADVDATAIAFRPRGGSRLVQLLSGDRALRLVTDTSLPIIALHGPEEGS